MTRRFTRQELYDLVWSEPVHKLAPRLDVSGTGLAKICRRYDIPVRERGYWARLEAGKPVVKRALPARGLGMSDTILIGTESHDPPDVRLARILAEPVPPLPTFDEEMAQVIERVQKLVTSVTVSRALDRPHALVARLLRNDERRREKQKISRYSWDAPLFTSPFEVRRLRIINGLFLALQRSGCCPWIRDRNARDIGVEVGHQNVAFDLDAVAARAQVSRPGPPATTRSSSAEKLRLTIRPWERTSGTGRSWIDTDDVKIEHHARDIVVELIVTGELYYRTGAVERHRWFIERRQELAAEARRRREENERRERERLAKLEQERLDRLFAAASNWRRAGDLRAFVDAVRAAYRQADSPEESEKLDRWTADALDAADRLDPLRSGRFELEAGSPIPPPAP